MNVNKTSFDSNESPPGAAVKKEKSLISANVLCQWAPSSSPATRVLLNSSQHPRACRNYRHFQNNSLPPNNVEKEMLERNSLDGTCGTLCPANVTATEAEIAMTQT